MISRTIEIAAASGRAEVSVTQIRIVGSGFDGREPGMWARLVLLDRLHETLHRVGRIHHRQLREEKAELFLVRSRELLLYIARELPEPLLERTQRLLPRLVEELLVGVRSLALVLRADAEPIVDLVPQLRRNVVVEHRLKIGREMDL